MADLQSQAVPMGGGGTDSLIPNAMISKRQRRPSVRLNEIGDQSADSYLRRTKQWKTLDEGKWKAFHEETKTPLLQHHHLIGPSKIASDLGLANKISKTRPLGHLGSNGNQGSMQVIHEEDTQNQNMGSGGGGGGGGGGSGSPSDVHLQIVEYLGGEQMNGRNTVMKSRNASRKVSRQGKGRRGGTRGASVVGAKFGRGIRASPEEVAEDNEKGSGEDGFGEPLSNASFDVETPEGFRDFDLDTSDSPGDMKETSALQVDSPENVVFNHQMVRDIYGNERDDFRDQGKSGETWVTAHNSKDHQALTMEYMDGNGLEMPSDTDTRSKQDANEFLMREMKHEQEKESVPVGRKHCSLLQDGGVRAWLNSLGLGRYTQLFEMHEVDSEALPLLTLDDLRDMGINAVGSRRKIYNAIQKLQKSFTV
ncbi:uncharacterized protein LOC131077038 [Cryptomeria japonica]|uniref:uncharacterized protein LOC131077038 n=1 Tax=Cryptomeria japonica TaxID=3369 RepID=UPI0027DAB124|nr:uncharacterized protein LOC131077038 [Cryptomeria japonica]